MRRRRILSFHPRKYGVSLGPESFTAYVLFAVLALPVCPAVGAVRSWNTDDGFWNNPVNWIGGVPSVSDTASLGDTPAAENAFVTLDVNATVAGLTVTDGILLRTKDNHLLVNGSTLVSGENTVDDGGFVVSWPSRLRMEAGGSLDTDYLTVADGARVEMDSGLLEVDVLLTVHDATAVHGPGTIRLRGDGAIAYVNDGGLGASADPMPLVINQLGDGRIDLDGMTGNGSVSAAVSKIDGSAFSTLTINGTALADPFDGTMTIGNNGRINMNLSSGWTLGTGELRLFGGNYGPATLAGGPLTLGGQVTVYSEGWILNDTTVNPSALVEVNTADQLTWYGDVVVKGGTFHLDQGGRVSFQGETTFQGGAVFNMAGPLSSDGLVNLYGDNFWAGGTTTFNAGVVRQGGAGVVAADTTVHAAVFDLDGIAGNSPWLLQKTFTLEVDSIDETPGDRFDAVLNINNPGILQIGSSTGGSLVVHLPDDHGWSLGGNINIVGSEEGGFSVIVPTVVGGADLAILNGGVLSATRRSAIGARLDIEGMVAIGGNDGSLRLDGGTPADPNTISGGSIQLSGTVRALSGRALFGHGVISTRVDFASGAELRADNGTLSLAGEKLLHVGTLGTNDVDGVLEVTGDWNTAVTDLVELRGGSLIGGSVANAAGKRITGHGTVAAAGLTNDGQIDAGGGLLSIDTGNPADLDGAAGNGVLDAVLGDLAVLVPVTDAFDGIASVAARRTMSFEQDWTLNTGGVLNLDGGPDPVTRAMVDGSRQTLYGTVNADLESHFDIETAFKSWVNVNLLDLNDVLRLYDDAHVEAGAAFHGDGTLFVAPGSALTAEHAAQIDVHVQNAGRVLPGESPGLLTVASFEQLASGILLMELQGTLPTVQHDQLNVLGDLELDGLLAVEFLDPYDPMVGDAFDLLDWGGDLTGEFETVSLPSLPPGMAWTTAALYTQGVIAIVVPEPGTGMLLLVGLVWLAMHGRMRRQTL